MEKCVYIKEQVLEDILIKKDMTCKKLADLVGITAVYMSNLKNANLPKYRPSGAVRKKILDALNAYPKPDLPADELVKWDDVFEIGHIDRTEEKKKPKAKKRKRVTA